MLRPYTQFRALDLFEEFRVPRVLKSWSTCLLVRNGNYDRGWVSCARPETFAVFCTGLSVVTATEPPLFLNIGKSDPLFLIDDFLSGRYCTQSPYSLRIRARPDVSLKIQRVCFCAINESGVSPRIRAVVRGIAVGWSTQLRSSKLLLAPSFGESGEFQEHPPRLGVGMYFAVVLKVCVSLLESTVRLAMFFLRSCSTANVPLR